MCGGSTTGGGGGGGARGSDSLVKFCPVFNFFNIRPFPGHPRVNPAPKIGFLGPVGLNSPSRYPKIQKKLKNMVKNRVFGLLGTMANFD